MKIRVHYDRNDHQVPFDEDVTTKFLHLSSGFGGGKSYGLAMKALKLSALNKNIPGGCVVPSIADYKKDLLPIFEDILEQNRIRYQYHRTDKWFKFPWSKARMYVASAEKSLRGPNWGWAVVNEATLIEDTRYKETIGRVRLKGTPFPQIASCGTPEGYNWLYDRFIEKPMANSRIIFGDTRNNAKNLADDYIQSLEDSYDQVMLDAYLKGLFVNMNGQRFYYAYDPHKNLSRELKRIDGEEVRVSMDFNVDPMTATLWHILPVLDANGRPVSNANGPVRRAIAFEQIELRGADTNKMVDAMKARDLHPDTTTIYPDPAGNARSTQGPSDVLILKNAGYYKIKTRSSAPHFRRRQLCVNNLLDKGHIQINPDTCPGLKKDLEAVEQDEVTFGKIKDNPKLTHFSDGMDYFADIEFPLSGVKPETRQTRIR